MALSISPPHAKIRISFMIRNVGMTALDFSMAAPHDGIMLKIS